MKIVVLNGSPKGDLSVTMQSVRFIEKHTAEHAFTFINVSQTINAICGKPEKFAAVMEEIAAADAVWWATPVYTFTVPSQIKRFIEEIFVSGSQGIFRGKATAVITTSINFFDNIAHNYLRAICDDLEMNFFGAFSADSYDLLDEKERGRLMGFATRFFTAVNNNWPQARAFFPVTRIPAAYAPASAPEPVNCDKKVVIITDETEATPGLSAMVRQLEASFSTPPVIVNLRTLNIAGPCMGCVQCGFDHQCIYTGKDDFIPTYENTVKTADLIFMAGTVTDRNLSYKWKEFFDRGFYNTHTPTLSGRQLGFLISGPLAQVPNLRQVLEAFTEWQGANLVDIVTDEPEDPASIDQAITTLVRSAVSMADAGYVKPATFLGKAGMKMFRDDVFGRHRFVFQADHAYFETHGIYDFPQDDKRAMDTNAFMFEVMKDPNTKEAIRKMLKTEMVKPHKKIVDGK